MRNLTRTVAMGLALAALGLAGTASAATQAELMKLHRGGTLELISSSSEGTIDPQVNYTAEYWQLYQGVYDGLVTFAKGEGADGNKIVPDLATEIPAAEDGGKTYVFHLRKGIKFSNGQEVTVNDVYASFVRIFKVKGPTAGTFYNGIVGADACLQNPDTCSLKDGIVVDPKADTVTFHLTAPDPEFFDKLAVPHASILPADSPMTDVGTKPLPGTGPYMFKSYAPNQELIMVRNPNFKQWSEAAQPDGFPDEIDYKFGLTTDASVTAVENGQADWMFDSPPTDRLSEIGTKYASQVHVSPLTAFYYLAMNVNLAPFDNQKVRQAVNYAIDRNALVNLFGGKVLAQPACTILPPGFPGYEAHCDYTKDPGTKWTAPDLAKAKELVKESGTAGQKVTVIVEDKAVDRNIGTYVQSVLNEIGYDASVKAISANIQFTYIQNTNNKVQISLSDWYQDYPAASDFLNVLLSCASFHPGSDSSINISGFCDKKVDADMAQAMSTAITDPAAANKEWAKIDQEVMVAAPMAPLFNPKRVDFVSKRLGNFVFSNQNQFIPELAWVK